MNDIKKIIYKQGYSCYTNSPVAKRMVVTITEDKVAFSILLLRNCSIYYPRIDFKYDVFGFEDDMSQYTHSLIWLGVGDVIESLENDKCIITDDYVPSKLTVEFMDGKKKTIEHCDMYSDLELIIKEIDNLMPSSLKMLLTKWNIWMLK